MNSRNAIEETKDAAGRVGRDLKAELADLSAEVEKLGAEISRRSRAGGRSVRAGAADGIAALNRGREDLAEGLGRGFSEVEDRAVAAVRERPVRSIGLALLFGFLLALIWRR